MRGLIAIALSVLAATGCGVQANSDATGEKRDCETITKLADVQTEVRSIDLGIQKDRPAEMTLAALPPLVEHYRAAVTSYRELEQRAREELNRLNAEPQPDADLVETWSVMVDSLRFRRDGIEFFANAFANPESLGSEVIQARAQRLEREQDGLNKQLEARMNETLVARGFEVRADGQFVLDCP